MNGLAGVGKNVLQRSWEIPLTTLRWSQRKLSKFEDYCYRVLCKLYIETRMHDFKFNGGRVVCMISQSSSISSDEFDGIIIADLSSTLTSATSDTRWLVRILAVSLDCISRCCCCCSCRLSASSALFRCSIFKNDLWESLSTLISRSILLVCCWIWVDLKFDFSSARYSFFSFSLYWHIFIDMIDKADRSDSFSFLKILVSDRNASFSDRSESWGNDSRTCMFESML